MEESLWQKILNGIKGIFGGGNYGSTDAIRIACFVFFFGIKRIS